MNDQIFNLSTHLRWSTIFWCSSWEVLRWRARRALSWTFFCLNMEQIRMKVSCKWKILAYRALRLTFAMCVITFGSNNEKSENYHRLIEMTGLTIIGDELVDPFSTGCCDLPANIKVLQICKKYTSQSQNMCGYRINQCDSGPKKRGDKLRPKLWISSTTHPQELEISKKWTVTEIDCLNHSWKLHKCKYLKIPEVCPARH